MKKKWRKILLKKIEEEKMTKKLKKIKNSGNKEKISEKNKKKVWR